MANDEGQVVKLGDVLSVLTDYHANGSYKLLKSNVELLDKKDYAIMIRTTNFEKNNFRDFKYITKNAYAFIKKSKVFPEDILMNKIANAGSIYLMPDLGCPVSLAMNLFLIRVKPELADQRFVYYALKAKEQSIKQLAVGTAAKTITKEAVKSIQINLPKIETQKIISHVLSLYDHLLEINIKRMETLTGLGWLAYQKTVIRKKAINWQKRKVGDITDFHKGKKIETLFEKEKAGTTKYLLIDGLRNSKFSYTSDTSVQALKDDIIMVMDGASSGEVFIGYEGSVGSTLGFFRVNKQVLSPYLLYYLLIENHEAITATNIGSAIPHANRDFINRLEIQVPSSEINLRFHNFAKMLLEEINVIRESNDRIRIMRNFLLPQLVAGKLTIRQRND